MRGRLRQGGGREAAGAGAGPDDVGRSLPRPPVPPARPPCSSGPMNTSSSPWYANHCIPHIAIQACSDEERQAFVVWAFMYLACDISAFLFLAAAFIRRFLLIEEAFNTIRAILILMLLCIPLYVVLRPFSAFLVSFSAPSRTPTFYPTP